MKTVEDYVTSIPDFPEPGIIFRDITSVIQDPEGLQLAIDGIKVAAKTGTAQIGTDNSAIDGWVIGFAPADDPQIAVAVLVHNTDVYGSLAAGPIMRAMMQEALQQ